MLRSSGLCLLVACYFTASSTASAGTTPPVLPKLFSATIQVAVQEYFVQMGNKGGQTNLTGMHG
jgi:hypothetical protein